MSMISTSGAIRLITPWQVPTKSSWSPKSERKVISTRESLNGGACGACDGGDETVEVVRLRLRHHADPGGVGGARGLRADRDRRQVEPERAEGLSGRGRREYDQLARGRGIGPEQPCAVERHEVRPERLDEVASGSFGTGEENASGRPGELRDETFLRGDARHEGRLDAVVAQRSRRTRADRGHRRPPAAASDGQLADGIRARDDDPVVLRELEVSGAGGLELDQRAADDLVPECLEAFGERLRLLPRPRHDHPQAEPIPNPLPPRGCFTLAAGGAQVCDRFASTSSRFVSAPPLRHASANADSSAASAAGSSPLRRSSQLPSSAATRAVSVSPS